MTLITKEWVKEIEVHGKAHFQKEIVKPKKDKAQQKKEDLAEKGLMIQMQTENANSTVVLDPKSNTIFMQILILKILTTIDFLKRFEENLTSLDTLHRAYFVTLLKAPITELILDSERITWLMHSLKTLNTLISPFKDLLVLHQNFLNCSLKSIKIP